MVKFELGYKEIRMIMSGLGILYDEIINNNNDLILYDLEDIQEMYYFFKRTSDHLLCEMEEYYDEKTREKTEKA